jgi:protein TonB
MKPAMAMGSSSISLYGSGADGGMSGPNWRHWTVSTALVGLLHVGGLSIAALRPPSSLPPPPPPAMAIDLAPLPPSPAPKVEPPPPPAPQPVETRPKPQTPPPRQTVKPQPAKLSATPIAPLPHTAEVAPAPQEMESAPVEPAVSTPPPAPAPAPAPANNAARPSAVSTWQRTVQQHLQSRKRYPRTAQTRRQEGIAVIRFVLDRHGTLLSAQLERSSGARILDEEAVDLVHRAQPLPPPPPEIANDRIEVTIPIEFMLK